MSQAPHATSDLVKSIQAVHSHLSAISTTATGDGKRLPKKVTITPNQLTWPETSRHMGVRRLQKCRGKVDSMLTAELMGEPNRK